jgi:hypothetical protein
VIELVTGNGAERPPADKRQNSTALRFGRAIHFSYPHLKQVTARYRPSKIVLVDKIKASEDWRVQAFLLESRWPNEYDFALVGTETDLAQITPDRFGIAGMLHR